MGCRRPLQTRAIDYSNSLDQELMIENGWLEGVARVESPNCDERPAGCEASLIVVHGISLPPGEFGGPWIDRLFTNTLPAEVHEYFAEIAHLRVSAHVLVRRKGEMCQYVPFTARAWHAGESSHCGRTACNDFSIGIELEGADDVPYTDVQYARLTGLVDALRRTYASLRDADIVGHEHIAPGRKTDPGPAFDWQRFRSGLDARARGSG
jgi:AmpD protein